MLKAAMNIWLQVCVDITLSFILGKHPEVESLGHTKSVYLISRGF